MIRRREFHFNGFMSSERFLRSFSIDKSKNGDSLNKQTDNKTGKNQITSLQLLKRVKVKSIQQKEEDISNGFIKTNILPNNFLSVNQVNPFIQNNNNNRKNGRCDTIISSIKKERNLMKMTNLMNRDTVTVVKRDDSLNVKAENDVRGEQLLNTQASRFFKIALERNKRVVKMKKEGSGFKIESDIEVRRFENDLCVKNGEIRSLEAKKRYTKRIEHQSVDISQKITTDSGESIRIKTRPKAGLVDQSKYAMLMRGW